MSLIQLLKYKKWEMRLFKMPRLETLRFQTGTKVTVASVHSLLLETMSSFDQHDNDENRLFIHCRK